MRKLDWTQESRACRLKSRIEGASGPLPGVPDRNSMNYSTPPKETYMPIYEFECMQCSSSREVLADYGTAKELDFLCVQCGGVMRAKAVSIFSLVQSSPHSSNPGPKPVKAAGTATSAVARSNQRNPTPSRTGSTPPLGERPNKPTYTAGSPLRLPTIAMPSPRLTKETPSS